MPIYEYLCPPCNRVFSFLVKSLAEPRELTCPKCGGKELRRQISRFAVTGTVRKSRGLSAGAAAAPGSSPPGPAEAGGDTEDPRLEQEMMQLMDAAEDLDERDPRQLGRLMRRLSEISGEPVEPAMEEAMRRLEAGEDPEKIEAEMGDALGDDGGDPGAVAGPPSHDPGLYEA